MTINIVFGSSANSQQQSNQQYTETLKERKIITSGFSRQIRNIFTLDPLTPSLVLQTDSKRKKVILKAPSNSLARFKVVIFDRSKGFPANPGEVYANIQNELYGEILPGGNIELDSDFAVSDIYAFSSVDNSPLHITVTEYQ